MNCWRAGGQRTGESSGELQRLRALATDGGQQAAPLQRTPLGRLLRGQDLVEDVVDGLRVGLAASGFHDLADEKLENAFVAGLVFGNVVRIFGVDLASGSFDGGVGDFGAQAFGGYGLCTSGAGA